MIAINQSNLVNAIGKPPVDLSLLVPIFTNVADFGAKTLTCTSTSTVSGADTYKHANVSVYDNHGGEVTGQITSRTGNTGALDISGLVLTDNLTVYVTVTSHLGIVATGSIGGITPGNLTTIVGNYITTFTTANF
jgi:hypothetical protein